MTTPPPNRVRRALIDRRNELCRPPWYSGDPQDYRYVPEKCVKMQQRRRLAEEERRQKARLWLSEVERRQHDKVSRKSPALPDFSNAQAKAYIKFMRITRESHLECLQRLSTELSKSFLSHSSIDVLFEKVKGVGLPLPKDATLTSTMLHMTHDALKKVLGRSS
jgi:hypothetical protein